MKKIIEIKHNHNEEKDRFECDFCCPFSGLSSDGTCHCYLGAGITFHDNENGKGHGEYELVLPTDKCPGPGKYRMSLEEVEEIKCEGCADKDKVIQALWELSQGGAGALRSIFNKSKSLDEFISLFEKKLLEGKDE